MILDPDDPALKTLSGKITKGMDGNLEKAQMIQKWLNAVFTYKVLVKSSIKEYLTDREAECGGYALVFTALASAAGIPARRVFAPVIMEWLPGLENPKNETPGSHAFSEFYTDEFGCVPVDNTGNKVGSILYAVILYRNGAVEDIKDAYTPATYGIVLH